MYSRTEKLKLLMEAYGCDDKNFYKRRIRTHAYPIVTEGNHLRLLHPGWQDDREVIPQFKLLIFF